MKTSKVIVTPYNEEWEADFLAIKSELEGALGNLIISIEHVGSTSVKGMSSKP